MQNKLKKTDQKGFTIIEVMIVLAIAGLILLIVFLAIPALQRNSRNTQRKNEAGSLAGAYSEYVNNHGGTAPPDAQAVYNNAKLSFYTDPATNITYKKVLSADTTLPAKPDSDQVIVLVNTKCDPTKAYDATKVTEQIQYSSRGGSIVYATESPTGDVVTCISTN